MQSDRERNPKGKIRLTNRTAIALRRSAGRVQRTWRIASAVLMPCMVVLAVFLGMRWLIAVPLVIALALLICMLMLQHGRTRYLQLAGEAICAESAARILLEQSELHRRRRLAKQDMDEIKRDIQSCVRKERDVYVSDVLGVSKVTGDGTQPPAQETRKMPPIGKETPVPTPPSHRRRRQAGFKVIHNENAK